MTRLESVAAFQHLDWESVPAERIAEGTVRRMVWGERLMVCRLEFAPGVVTAVHSHPHEQITMVVAGRVTFFVEGRPTAAAAGDILCFPAHIEHGATMREEPVVLIDIFTPVREDFLSGGGYAGAVKE